MNGINNAMAEKTTKTQTMFDKLLYRKHLEETGAAVVEINCGRGPRTMLVIIAIKVCHAGQYCNQRLPGWSILQSQNV